MMESITRARGIKFAMILLVLLWLSACGKARASSVTLELSSQEDQLAFTTAILQAKVGEAMTITFNNKSKALQHNWVLVKGGDDVAQQVSEAAVIAGLEQEALLANNENVLAHTALLKSGETATLTFRAPAEPGQYIYLCTFPGHYLVGMKGTLVVEP
jgi:azurin